MSLEEDLQSLQIPPEFADYRRRLICYSDAKTMEDESASLRQALREFGVLERPMRFSFGGTTVEVWYLANEAYTVAEVIAAMRQRFENKIRFEADGRMGLLQLAVNDPLYPQQWALQKIEAAAAWNCVAQAPAPQQVTVAIVDSGVMGNHEDLQATPKQGFPIIATANGPLADNTGHGTMLAGIIGAVSNNMLGIAGEGRNVRILSIKFTDERTPPSALAAGLGVLAAVLLGAGVINCAWHVLATTPLLRLMIEFATQQGCVVVIAAGNYGSDNTSIPTLPASWANAIPGTIAVMASDRDDFKCWFSNYGDRVDLAAPGQSILSTGIYYVNARYPESSGTSAASAHVSAAAALLLSIDQWTPQQIRTHLNESADRPPVLWGTCISEGRLNLRRAVCGPFQIVAPAGGLPLQGGTPFNVQWTLEYNSTIVQTAEISFRNAGNRAVILGGAVFGPFAANAGQPGQLVNVPIQPPGIRTVIRIRSLEKNLYTDSDVFEII
jgi:thermitase